MEDTTQVTDQGPVELNEFEQEVRLDLDVPEEAPVEGSAASELPVEPEDRSEYNCPDCKGEGLLNEATICSNCNGTGKV